MNSSKTAAAARRRSRPPRAPRLSPAEPQKITARRLKRSEVHSRDCRNAPTARTPLTSPSKTRAPVPPRPTRTSRAAPPRERRPHLRVPRAITELVDARCGPASSRALAYARGVAVRTPRESRGAHALCNLEFISTFSSPPRSGEVSLARLFKAGRAHDRAASRERRLNRPPAGSCVVTRRRRRCRYIPP